MNVSRDNSLVLKADKPVVPFQDSSLSAPEETAKPLRIGILGGTFDPIHVGHLVLGDEARAVCHLDKVIFVPTAISVFKRDHKLADPQLRLKLCQQAVADNDYFEVSSIEIDRGGDSYTVDTLLAFKERYPNASLSFIVGSDALKTMDRWYKAETIASLATVICGARPGFELEASKQAALDALGYHITYIHGPSLEISSTMIRERLESGLPIHYLVGDQVADLIKTARLYSSDVNSASEQREAQTADAASTNSKVLEFVETPTPPISQKELLSKDFYRARKQELASRVSPERLHHSIGVAKTAKKLAQAYGVDPAMARLAGILHDWDKGLNADQQRARVHELAMEDEVDPWSITYAPGVLHGHTAARALELQYPNLPDEVLEAIRRHTTAVPHMSDLDMILYIADALEPHRDFDGLDELRSLIGVVPLEELFFRTYRLWVSLLMERGRLMHPDTISNWNSYVLAAKQ